MTFLQSLYYEARHTVGASRRRGRRDVRWWHRCAWGRRLGCTSSFERTDCRIGWEATGGEALLAEIVLYSIKVDAVEWAAGGAERGAEGS